MVNFVMIVTCGTSDTRIRRYNIYLVMISNYSRWLRHLPLSHLATKTVSKVLNSPVKQYNFYSNFLYATGGLS